jgi:Zn-dependent protease
MKITSEIKEIAKAWIAISIAFGILINLEGKSLGFSILIAAITVGLGFLAHELAHRHYARKFGKHAEFKANNTMLIFALISSLFGFIFAAPGAVIISGFVNRKEGGIIASAGPIANLAVALVFLPFIFIPVPTIKSIAFYGLMINSLLALFNLIPFPGFDGNRIMEWSKIRYAVLLAIAIIINLIHFILPNIMQSLNI